MNRQQATKKADKLFSAYIRAVPRCQAFMVPPTRCNGNLQCAHVLSRRYRAIRWDEANAMALCAAHHLYFTHKPLEWEQYCRDEGIEWDELRHRALNDPPQDPFEVIARYAA